MGQSHLHWASDTSLLVTGCGILNKSVSLCSLASVIAPSLSAHTFRDAVGLQGQGKGHPTSWLCLPSAYLGFPPPENLPQEADRDEYQLLCRDNTRKSVDEYKDCYLASIPSHAVVARSVDGKEDLIWGLLNQAQVLNPPSSLLFGFGTFSFIPFLPL